MPDPDTDPSEGNVTAEETRPTRLADEAELDAFCNAADVVLLQFYKRCEANATGLDPVDEADNS